MTGDARSIVLFEPAVANSLGPPADHRPVWAIRVGALSLAERIAAMGFSLLGGWTRPALTGLVPLPALDALGDGEVLLLSGDQLLLEPEARDRLLALRVGEGLGPSAAPIATCLPATQALAWIEERRSAGALPAPQAVPRRGPLGPAIEQWWEIFELAAEALSADLPRLLARGDWRSPARGDWAASENIHLAAGVEVAQGAVLDASGGPIVLDAGVSIGANSFVQGPCYLGPSTRVKPSSQLLHGCYAGRGCRLGGEIEETQFQGFANKQHHGFLGHAVVGEWVNLGAGVTNSDLKNNYSDVRVLQRGRQLNSHRRFLGCCLGDHVKVAIQGRINTGTVLEAFSNWFGAGFPPKGLPAFTWAGDGVPQTYELKRALDTAAVVMGRRGRALSPELGEVYREHFRRTVIARREAFHDPEDTED